MSEYFPEPKSSGGKLKVELYLSNYATKADLKKATGVDTSNFKSNVDELDVDKLKNVPSGLSSLKSKIDKSDVDKLVPVPVDLSKLSNVVKNNAVKKDLYNAKVKNIEDKIPDITNLATKATPISEINEVKNKMPNITNLTANTALTTVENEIPE